MKIHKTCLPKEIHPKTDKSGFIIGDFFFDLKTENACFMQGDKTIFECSRPVAIVQTQSLIRYVATVFTGNDKQGRMVGKLCELTIFFV